MSSRMLCAAWGGISGNPGEGAGGTHCGTAWERESPIPMCPLCLLLGVLLPLLGGLDKYLRNGQFCSLNALEQILSIGGFQRVAVFFIKVGGEEYTNTVLQYCCRLLGAPAKRRSPWVSCVDEKLPSSSSQPSFGLRWVFEPEAATIAVAGQGSGSTASVELCALQLRRC